MSEPDVRLEVRIAFLDILKAFDQVWDGGNIFKLTQNGISENLLNLLQDLLKEKKNKA